MIPVLRLFCHTKRALDPEAMQGQVQGWMRLSVFPAAVFLAAVFLAAVFLAAWDYVCLVFARCVFAGSVGSTLCQI
jgi:hypothetical protein